MPQLLTSSSGATPLWVPRAQTWLGLASMLVGGTVLIGWLADLPALMTWGPQAATRPLSALGFVLGGATLTLVRPAHAGFDGVRRVLAALTALLGAAVLAEWTIRPLGDLDHWLQNGHGDPGAAARPAAHVALALVLFGLARAFSAPGPRLARWVAAISAVAFAMVALIIGTGFVMRAHVLIGPSRAQGIPAPTTAAVILLGLGLVVSYADHRPMRWLWDRDLAGRLIRRLIPPAILLPLAFGLAYLGASIDGRLDARAGLVMLTSAMIIALISLVTLTGSLVERIQRERDHLTRQLDAFFAHTPGSMSLRDPDGVFLRVNRTFTEHTRLAPDAILGRPMAEVYPPDQLAWAKAEFDEVLSTGCDTHSEITADLGDGDRDFDVTRFPVLDERGQIIGVGTLTFDVTERRAADDALRSAERRYRELSERDPLTGLYNRRRFREALTQHLDACRGGVSQGAVISIDLDGFKEVNDQLGHDVGDQLLIAVGQTLASRLRSGDLVARHGGDEFLVLLDEGGEREASAVAIAIVAAVEAAARALDPLIAATASAGVVVLADLKTGDLTTASVMGRVDRALYAAKNEGRNRISISKV